MQLVGIWLVALAGIGLAFLFVWQSIFKLAVKKLFQSFMTVLMTDPYQENLTEFFSAAQRTGLLSILQLNLRAQEGKVIERPLGSGRKFPDFSGLMFDVAQLHTFPTEASTSVDTKVVLGPQAEKPLILDTPLIVSGMAFGLALSAKAKIALARGTAMAGTAVNSGQGPFLQAERDNSKYWILQYSRGFWSKEPEILSLADAVEIQFGQGAMAGMSFSLKSKDIDPRLQGAFPIPPGRDAVVKARHQELEKPEDLGALVEYIRSITGGIPVGVKMACSKDLELDLAIALQAGVDFIALGGAQGGTHAAPPSLGDNFGLPTLYALVRAARFLEENRAKDRITLISAGGFTEPGEMLKALALGADAIYIGTAALFAISHTQVLQALPWEPPTQIVWYNAKYSDRYDENLGAQNLANFINSCTLEIAEGVRVLGKSALSQVTKGDLYALDPLTAEIAGVPLGYRPTPVPRTNSKLHAPSKPPIRYGASQQAGLKKGSIGDLTVPRQSAAGLGHQSQGIDQPPAGPKPAGPKPAGPLPSFTSQNGYRIIKKTSRGFR